MAAASRVLRSVKPHIPLIRFHARQKNGKDASNLPQSVAVGQTPTTSKTVGNVEKGSGIDFFELPMRYQRKPLSQEEIEFIERGGPD